MATCFQKRTKCYGMDKNSSNIQNSSEIFGKIIEKVVFKKRV